MRSVTAGMKIYYFSDLHIDTRKFTTREFEELDADLVILAGDITNGIEGVQWAKMAFNCPVLYVPGNHEFYRGDIGPERFSHNPHSSVVLNMKYAARSSNVTILDNEAIVIEGIRYVGSTLWTDFNILGCQEASMDYASGGMADFLFIRNQGGALSPRYIVSLHDRGRTFIENELKYSAEPVVVISHHPPSIQASRKMYHRDALLPSFVSDLEYLFKPPLKAWISGHTHYTGQWLINSIPLLSNQWGYARELRTLSFRRLDL